MAVKLSLIISSILVCCLCQRSPYAGRSPIGFPNIAPELTNENVIGNRFGDDNSTTTTERLPVEARGDRELVERLRKLPMDQQPFWLINWQALDDHRKNPQSFPQKENTFIDALSNVGSRRSDSSDNRNPIQEDRRIDNPLDIQSQAKLSPGLGNDQRNLRFFPQNSERNTAIGDSNNMQDVGNSRFVPQMNQGGNMQNMQRPMFTQQNTQVSDLGNSLRPAGFNTQNNRMNNLRPQGFQRGPIDWDPTQRFPNPNIQRRNMNFGPRFGQQNRFNTYPYDDFKEKE